MAESLQSTPRHLRDAPSLRLGIDLGGSKIEIVALDVHGTERLRRRVPTPKEDYPATLAAVAGLVNDAEHELQTRGTVGIGTPGSISRATGLLRGSNSVCLNGQPVRRDLEAVLGRPVRITNDANCFALSEATDGAGAGAGVVFGAILGTGVGAGIVVHGHVLSRGDESAESAHVLRRVAEQTRTLAVKGVRRKCSVRSGRRRR